MNPETKKEQAPNSFLSVMQRKELNDGTLSELNEKIAEVAAMVLATGKTGSVSIKLEMKPQGAAIHIKSKITFSKPMPEETPCIFFYQDGALVRNNPNQREFELAAVDGGKTETPAAKAQAS